MGNRLFGREQPFPVRCEMDGDNKLIQTSRTVQNCPQKVWKRKYLTYMSTLECVFGCTDLKDYTPTLQSPNVRHRNNEPNGLQTCRTFSTNTLLVYLQLVDRRNPATDMHSIPWPSTRRFPNLLHLVHIRNNIPFSPTTSFLSLCIH